MTIVDTDAQRFSLWFTRDSNRQKWTFCISQHLHNNSPCDYYDFRLFLMTQDYRNPFKSRKSTTSMNSINAFADIRVRYPKINEIFKVCQLLCCAQNIVHHYYSYSQKLSNWALLSITTIIRWKEKGHAHIYLSNCWVFCSAYKLNISCKARLPWATIPFFVFRISLVCKTFL